MQSPSPGPKAEELDQGVKASDKGAEPQSKAEKELLKALQSLR